MSLRSNPTLVPLVLTGYTILVVEDHQDLRRYLVRLLSGYRVRSAKDGAEALGEIKRCVPDLIVSDVMMPNVDGFELCAKVKSDPSTSHVPIILLTAQAGQEVVTMCVAPSRCARPGPSWWCWERLGSWA